MYLIGKKPFVLQLVHCVSASDKSYLYVKCFRRVTACVVNLVGLPCDYLFSLFS